MASLYQKRLAARRKTADITRLADQYKRNVEALAGEQEKSFGQYQADVQKQMAPYEAQVAQYNQAFKVYESQAAAYNQRISDYQKMLDEFNKNPYERIQPQTFRGGRGGNVIGAIVDGEKFTYDELMQGGYEPEPIYGSGDRGGRVVTGIASIKVPRPAPDSFSEAPPAAPTAPTAPKIAEFDSSQFDVKRGQLETEYSRELGERKSSRLSAVARRTARPLMQGQG